MNILDRAVIVLAAVFIIGQKGNRMTYIPNNDAWGNAILQEPQDPEEGGGRMLVGEQQVFSDGSETESDDPGLYPLSAEALDALGTIKGGAAEPEPPRRLFEDKQHNDHEHP